MGFPGFSPIIPAPSAASSNSQQQQQGTVEVNSSSKYSNTNILISSAKTKSVLQLSEDILKPVIPAAPVTPVAPPVAGNILIPQGGLEQPKGNFDPIIPSVALEAEKARIEEVAKTEIVAVNPPTAPPSRTTPIAGNINTPQVVLINPQGNFDPLRPSVAIDEERKRIDEVAKDLEVIPPSRNSGFGQVVPMSLPVVPPSVSPSVAPIGPVQLEPLSLAPGKVSDSEVNIFGLESLLKLPVNPESSEHSSGLSLEKWEKPRILAVVAQQIKDGYQEKNTIIFRKVISNRTRVENYTILKKNIFKEKSEFKVAARLSTLYMNLDAVKPEHIEYINQMGYNPKECFVYEDPWISPNSAYAYKIEIEWVSNGQEPKNPQTSIISFDAIASLADYSKFILGA